MTALPLNDQQIKAAAATHATLVNRQALDQQMQGLYSKQTLKPAEMNQMVALKSARQAYQEPSESDMKNHASVVSTAEGRKALGIKGKWPSSSTPTTMDGSGYGSVDSN